MSYPMVVPLPVDVIRDINNNFHITGCYNYCPDTTTNCRSCGNDTTSWWGAIENHLSTISDMGFNVVRLNGLSIKYVDDSINTVYDTTGTLIDTSLIMQNVYVQDPNDLYCFMKDIMGDVIKENYVFNNTTFERQAKLIAEFVNVVKKYNANEPEHRRLRITITTGTGTLVLKTDVYKDYLIYLGNYFK